MLIVIELAKHDKKILLRTSHTNCKLHQLSCQLFIRFFVLFSSDSFVNSQEWTLSRSVPELKVVSNSDV